MVLPTIAVLGYRNFIELIKGIVETLDMNVNINVFQCFLEECLPILPELESKADVIITGRANQKFLQDKTKIPIITFRITPMDILSSIQKALSHSRHVAIALATFESLEYDYTILENLLDLKLTFIAYNTEGELQEKLKNFSKTKGSVIGTSIAVAFARELGMPSYLIYSLEKTIIEAVERATEIMEFKRREDKKNKEFEAILNSVSDGIIATNAFDEITLINNSARRLLNIQQSEARGHKLDSLLPPAVLHKYKENRNFQNEIISIGAQSLNANRTTVDVRGRQLGNVITFQEISQIEQIEQKYRLKIQAKGLIARSNFEDIIHCSDSPIQRVIENAKKFSTTDSTILIIGDTGTGKELFAQSIHNYSSRCKYPFVAINCAALPESLLESELFGYEDGAFTGASKHGKKGLFEIAHRGTIFLDEINSIPPHFQSKLLRVLQEKEVKRIGSESVIPIDVRVIAASNIELSTLIHKSDFRPDLFYRLNVLRLTIPSLQERIIDLPLLVAHFISHFNETLYHKICSFLDEICHDLKEYKFPGNIRELENIIERFVVLCDYNQVHRVGYCKELLRECMDERTFRGDTDCLSIELQVNYKESMYEAERILMLKYLEQVHGDKSLLAKTVGISKATLYRKLKELRIE
ncbi:sigma 54-interacting transcriptional regulator [Alicyclobacillus tolerans]|uniref:sigma 54-interacting transcriptional regulator n=1 Tax=Alicyclobacillus tolerans TaxID=90970 RepID=UPI001EFFD3E8|nr:sigma 54-interacting transcriptional regulator [Alicyclobacillus tolerans]MCF8568512.1 sigma 54-interacting transcriptional regulator [Alicyclobacillus tolerans]